MAPTKHILTSIFFVAAVLSSCERRKIRYAGLNDKLIGPEQVILFENGEFYLEMDQRSTEGTYTIKGDTVLLQYKAKPSPAWPGYLTMTDEYFLVDHPDTSIGAIKIDR